MISGPTPTSVEECLDQAHLWLTKMAWPIWLEHGVDWKRQAFHESLEPDGLRCTAAFRRLRVAARQTYVFSMAAKHKVPGAEKAVALGIDFLLGAARLPDGGFAWRFDLDNKAIDTTLDLYDHAFVLLAFSSAASMVGREPMHQEAVKVMTFLDAHFRHPMGGYVESIPTQLPRRQNPHMHLLEAYLAAFDAFEDIRFLDRASELIDLFLDHLFQAPAGALAEYFDDHLSPVYEAGCFAVEPGHHYEWIWLLACYENAARIAGRQPRPELGMVRDRLADFADRYGVDPRTGLVKDIVWSNGRIVTDQFRLWPQTERIKREIRRNTAEKALQLDGFRALYQHFDGAAAGLWHERLSPDGQPSAQSAPAPATSLYHICCAIADASAAHKGLRI